MFTHRLWRRMGEIYTRINKKKDPRDHIAGRKAPPTMSEVVGWRPSMSGVVKKEDRWGLQKAPTILIPNQKKLEAIQKRLKASPKHRCTHVDALSERFLQMRSILKGNKVVWYYE